MRALIAPAFLLLLSSSAFAEPPALAVKALERLDAVDNDDWSYTMTSQSKEGRKVERHDVSKPDGERWTLVQKDGRAPTAAELRAYQKEKAGRAEAREEQEKDDEQDVDLSSIRLVSEDAVRATYSFRLRSGGKLEAGFTKHILGTLVVNKDGGWAERFEMSCAKPFRPVPGVRVDEFRIVMTFQRDAASGAVFFTALESKVRGRALMVKSLDDDAFVRFTDFRRP